MFLDRPQFGSSETGIWEMTVRPRFPVDMAPVKFPTSGLIGSREIVRNPYGEYSSPWIKCAISAGCHQYGGTCSADLNRLTDEFWILGRKRTGLPIWFLGHARTAVHTIRLLPNGFRDESTEVMQLRGNSNAAVHRAVAGTRPHRPSRRLPSQESAAGCPPPDGCAP